MARKGTDDALPRSASIDHLSERMIPPVAVGRKNYPFMGSNHGGKAAAVLYRVMASAKANHVEPLVYMRDLLVQLSGHSPPPAAAILPDVWLRAPQSSSVLVEVAGLPGATKS